MNRKSDQSSSRTYFRSDRYFMVSNQWFFATREDGDHGPYPSRAQAEHALHDYLIGSVGLPAAGWEVPGAQN